MNIIEHFQTLLNIYFQEELRNVSQVQQPPAKTTSSTCTKSQVASTDDSARVLKQKFRCKVKGCNHAPFTIQYGLAQHIVTKHEKQGSICAICGCIMSEHYLEGHFDTHRLSNRYICKEKRDGEVCNKDYH